MSESTPLPCESTCGADTYCPMPPLNCTREEWQAFWRKHPSRARYSTPLSREAALRRGARP